MEDGTHEFNTSRDEKSDSKVGIKEKTKAEVAPNWNVDEITLLNDLCSQRLHIIDARFDANITKAKKWKVWEDIATQIRALNVYPRTAGQCRKRWQNEKNKANKKVRSWVVSSRKTGV